MMRTVAAVIVGYVVMAVLVVALFSGLFVLMGTDRSFVAGSWEPSILWIAVTSLLSLVIAVIGGLVCKLIGKSMNAVWGLLGLVIVLGALSGFMMQATPQDSTPRPASVSNFEAMNNAREPLAVSILNPIIGAIGVFIGGKLKKD